ncbi:MAG: UDP-3-O-[3-hydroxymyristoyl] N-acetylglucosamine deacetylase [Candidatus Aminicenantes bacterium]|nr:UDP-3-O-[3-hydroxymyristoyl] N-acetylglucosamine deacetylase [Candidatus Aminicenantes bacterium]
MKSSMESKNKMQKVLIIDDEKNIQASLASVIEDEGYKVFFSTSGEEGVEKFKNIKPDVTFVDIWLPGIDGLETMRRILEVDPVQIIIMISGHGSITTAVRALKEGAYDFMEKPLSIDKVIFALQRGLEYKKILEENRMLKSMLSDNRENDPSFQKIVKRESTGRIEFEIGDVEYSRKQKTIRKDNIFYGIGLHSGQKTGMSLKPLPEGKGIRFENITEVGYVPARIEYIDTTNYATSVRKDILEAKTIEHLMAVLHAFGITNISIKINKEVPTGDGSASVFCDLIRKSGVVEQGEFITDIIIDRPLVIGNEKGGGKFIRVDPADIFTVNYTAEFPEPMGKMSYEFVMHSPEDFEREIAPARTFGFVEEINKMSQMGLAEGGRINNFILIDKGRVLNTELRFKDELVRHKILDIIGDFYLLGRSIQGKITAFKTGHSDNIQMVNLIKEKFLTQ